MVVKLGHSIRSARVPEVMHVIEMHAVSKSADQRPVVECGPRNIDIAESCSCRDQQILFTRPAYQQALASAIQLISIYHSGKHACER